MNLQHLYYFRTVAKLQHYRNAAELLHVNPSTITYAIHELEEELGVKLFERQGRNIKLTKYGEFFLEYCAKALDTLEEGKKKLFDFVNPMTGSITLGYVSNLLEFIPYVISEFYKWAGSQRIKFQLQQYTTDVMADRLTSGAVDFAFVTSLDHLEVESTLIGTQSTVVITAHEHPFAKKESIDLHDLRYEYLITYDYKGILRADIDAIFQSLGFYPQIISESTYDNIVIQSVASNLGVALITDTAVMHNNSVKVLPIHNGAYYRSMHMVWTKSKYKSPVVNAFQSFVVERGCILDDFLEQAKR